MKSKFKERKVQITEIGGLGGLAFIPFFFGDKNLKQSTKNQCNTLSSKIRKEITIIIFITRNLFNAGPLRVPPS